MSWDKELCGKIQAETGLPHGDAMVVVGMVADMRDHAYRQGYGRGYKDGSHDTEIRLARKAKGETTP